LRRHELKREPKTNRQKHEVRLLKQSITVSPSTRKYSSQVARHQAEREANQDRPKSSQWAPPSSGNGTTGQVHSCATCDQPGHRSSECAALQVSRLMREVGPSQTAFRTAHLAMRYSEPTTPLWELTVKRRNAVTIAEVEDPPRIPRDPSAPQWAPVTSMPSIFARLLGYESGSHLHEAEDDTTVLIIQATIDMLNDPCEDDQTVIPEETTDFPAPAMSKELEQALFQEQTEGIDMQLGDEQWELEDDLMAGYIDDVGNPDWEVPNINFIVTETARPHAAQSGVIYPASSN
jgi:hypothetical protein